MPVTLADGRSHLLLLDTGNVSSWLVADTARSLGLELDPIEHEGKAVYPHLAVRVIHPQQAGTGASAGELKLITFGKEGPPIVAIGKLGLGSAAAAGRPKYFPYTDGGVMMNELPHGKSRLDLMFSSPI